MQLKPQVDLPEMRIAREDVGDLEILHDYHAREIDKGDVRLILVFLPQLPGVAELLGGDVDKQVRTRVDICQNRVDKTLSPGQASERRTNS
jgi:hypothetical protein